MGLLAPSLLLGLIAAVVPYLIHRLGRRPPKPQAFAAMELLLAAHRRVRARHRLRELLLLIVRTLVAAALPLVFARPFVERESDAPALAMTPQSAVLVLDDSASMQRRWGRTTPFEKARAQALAISRQLPSGSALALVMASEGTAAPIADLTLEKSRVSDALENATPSARPADFEAAIKRATGILGNALHKERRIFVLTDAQAAGWGEAETSLGEGAPDLAIEDVTRGEPWSNRAVIDVEATPLPEAGASSVAITATLAQWGGTNAKPVGVSLKIDGTVVAKASAELPASGQVQKRFVHVMDDSSTGLHEVQVEIDNDDFPLDDQRFASLAMIQALRVLVVNGDSRAARNEDEGFFLNSALTSAGTGISVTTVLPDEAEDLDLSRYGVVFLANVAQPSAQLAAALAQFVAKGGGVFFSVGENVDPDAWNSRMGGVLPQPLGVVRTAATQGTSSGELVDDRPAELLAPLDRRHPLLAQFVSGEDGLASARFYKFMLLEPVSDDVQHKVILRFESGSPALVERTFSAASRNRPPGRTMLLATTIDREWTDLAIRPGYLPLMVEATRRLGGGPEGGRGAELLVGQARVLDFVGAEDSIEVVKPNGATWVSRRQQGQAGAKAAQFGDTQQPGVYRVRTGSAGEASRTEVPNRTFVVNLDSVESDPKPRTRAAPSNPEAAPQAEKPRHKVPLWHGLAMLVVALLLVESIVTLRRRPPLVSASAR